jgi:diaminopimelate epimerase
MDNCLNLPKISEQLCDRHFGIGGDGLILVLPSEKADLRMRIYNSDGSEAQMCGNGIRCFAKYAYENQLISKHKFTVETLAGMITPELIFTKNIITGIKVNMGIPKILKKEIPMKGAGNLPVVNETLRLKSQEELKITCVSMGNPHCVLFVDNVNSVAVNEIGPLIENHTIFPEKTNVEFIQILNRKELNFRVWERGVGETLACGTGACAALVAGVLNNKIENRAIIHLKGGDLDIEWIKNGPVFMTGPANFVFRGKIAI